MKRKDIINEIQNGSLISLHYRGHHYYFRVIEDNVEMVYERIGVRAKTIKEAKKTIKKIKRVHNLNDYEFYYGDKKIC